MPRILLVKWVVYLDNLQNPEADTLFRNYDGGHWYIQLVHVSSLTSVSQTAVKLFLWEGKNCHLHYISAVMPLVVSWVSFWQFWELLRHSTCLLLVSFFVTVPSGSAIWSEVSSYDVVCESTSFLCFSWGVCVLSLVSAVESFWKLANLNYPQISPKVAARQHMGLVEQSFAGLRSFSQCSGVEMWHFS